MSLEARPRDYVETADGLYFAIVSPLRDAGGLIASLRYAREQDRLRKLDTGAAAVLLHERHPGWIRQSPAVGALVHVVPGDQVIRVLRPEDALRRLSAAGAVGPVSRLARLLEGAGADLDVLGITGSFLLGAEHDASDVDLVAYGRASFESARRALQRLLDEGTLQALSHEHWIDAWERRGRALSLDEYVWHEARKGTKALLDDRRIDLSLVANRNEQAPLPAGVRKVARAAATGVVTDATAAFDHPARYPLAGADVIEVMSFTPTYAGQARAGERIEASGWLEEDGTGTRRLVVGTSREAGGEWIKVLR